MSKQEHTFVHAKCPECGGQLKFIEGKRKLACTSCKYKRELSNRYGNIVTKKALKDRVNLRDFTRGFGSYPLKEYKCGNGKCKAVLGVKRNAKLEQCPFCHGTDLKEGADRQNKNLFPDQMIPPTIPRKAATAKLRRHLGSIFLNLYAPGIKDVLKPENMKGVYLPAFLFDAYTRTKWRGDAGFKYTYTIPDSSGGGGNKGGKGGGGRSGRGGKRGGGGGGKQQSGTLWESIDGYFEQLYDNLFILGSDTKERGSEGILGFDVKDLVRFSDRYMGTEWAVELYQKDDIKFFEEADGIIDKDLADQARKKLTSNNKRIEGNKKLEVVSEKSAITFRHIWVPIWIVVFAYDGKHFQFIVNAQTGRIYGKRPLSTIRIIIVVAVALLILLLIAIFTR
ncbi:MAG: hypothetical protein AB8H47_15195 [Bacteroidia bacterium]